MILARAKVIQKIRETNNKPYYVRFKKQDGTLRNMLAQQGVTRNLKGGKNLVEKDDNSYLTTFDLEKQGYRTINLDTVEELVINGIEYKVKG